MKFFRSKSIIKAWLTISVMAILQACGAAHVRTESHSPDLHQYDSVYISDVRVYSLEANAKDNKKLQTLMYLWENFARQELRDYIHQSHYQLVGADQPDNPLVLAVDLDINVRYGNRAMRYWVGYGAGFGSVDSTLTVTDSKTGQQKFRAVAESDLAVGAFGGSIEDVLKDNIKELIDQYPEA